MALRTNVMKHPKTGVYYFRKGVPERLRPFMPGEHKGKREILISLRTKDRSDAARISIEIAVQAEKLFDYAKQAYALAHPSQDGVIRVNMAHLPLKVPQDDFFLAIDYGHRFVAQDVPSTPALTPPSISNHGTSINKIFSAYLREKKVAEDTAYKYRLSWELFCDYTNITMESPISLPTLAHIREFKRDILDYPSRTTKAMREKGVHALLKYARDEYANPDRKTTFEPINIKTLKQHLAAIGAVLRFANVNGDRLDDPTSSGICKVQTNTDDEESRPPYNQSDLKGIFGHSIFLEPVWDYRQWMPLLALHTGCRAAELGLSLIEDIKETNGTYYLSIRRKDDSGKVVKRVKNKSSVRSVPIHSSLIACGFIKYVDGLKANGETRLFPTLKSLQYFSSLWGQMRDEFGITDDSKVFHSFRHSFRDAIRRAKIDRETGKRLMGHSTGDIHDDYGDGLDIGELRDAIEKITYSVDLPKIDLD